jgi:hypothetical protein
VVLLAGQEPAAIAGQAFNVHGGAVMYRFRFDVFLDFLS